MGASVFRLRASFPLSLFTAAAIFAASALPVTPSAHGQRSVEPAQRSTAPAPSSAEAARLIASARASLQQRKPITPQVGAPPTVSAAQNWVQASPATSPPARSGATMAYDAATQQVVLFGGAGSSEILNDTWTYNGTTWTQQAPASSPPARYWSTMAYDAATGQVVLFGGNNGSSYLGDTWTYNGTTWTQPSLATSPSARIFSTMAYDAATGQLVLFGGGSSTDGDLADTWAYNGTTWTQQSPPTSPPGRSLSPMVYSAAIGKVVLFGGSSVSGLANDTWTYDGTTWTQQTPATSPPVRDEATMAYDVASSQVVLFGGFNGGSSLGDTWTYNGTTWTQQNLASSPSAREFSAMAYDAATGQVLLFGGSGGTLLDDTWNYVSGVPSFANTAVGSSTTGTATFTFTTGGSIGAPVVLTQGAPNLDFTDAGTGTCTTNGTSHSYAMNDTCTVVVNFAPKYPGQRLGAIEITSTTGTVLYTELISGMGTGPLLTLSPGLIGTVAGNGTSGYTGSQDTGTTAATAASLNNPFGVAVDGAGNLYIADSSNYRIRKVTAATGFISTVAGGGTAPQSCTGSTNTIGDGCAATAASLYNPTGVAVDGAGNLYIADSNNYRIRKVTAATGFISTVAGNGTGGYTASQDTGTTAATAASLDYPEGAAVDGAGNLYIADQYNQRIRKVTAATGFISTVAGNGTAGYTASQDTGTTAATAASLNYPEGVAVDGAGNLYIADEDNQRIRKVTAATGSISTVAGNGTAGYTASQDTGTTAATAASLYYPQGMAVDGAGNLYIADYGNHRIRKVTATTGYISTVAGNGTGTYVASQDTGTTAATAASLGHPTGVTVEGAGNLYIADSNNNRIRKVSTTGSIVFPTATAAGSADSTDGTQTAILNNIGNTALTLASMANASSGNFVLGNPNTGGCSTSVAAGGSCLLGETFAPASGSTGLVTGSLAITDNSLNAGSAVQHVPLIGNVTAGTVSAEIFGTTVTHGAASTTLTLVFGYGGTAADTGAITVTVNGSATGVGTPTCTSKPGHMNCVYPYTGTALATPGSYPLAVSVAADSTDGYSAGSGTGTLTVQ